MLVFPAVVLDGVEHPGEGQQDGIEVRQVAIPTGLSGGYCVAIGKMLWETAWYG